MDKIKKEAKLFGKFSLVGVINFLIGYFLISALMFFGVAPRLSNAISYSIGFLVSFFLRKRFVFQSDKKYLPEFVKFSLTFGCAYCLNLIVLSVLLHLNYNPYFSQFLAACTYVGSSYILFRKWVFN